MASAQESSSTVAPSRKDHLEAGKKRVGPLLLVAREKCRLINLHEEQRREIRG
jgi:hypothetical protein